MEPDYDEDAEHVQAVLDNGMTPPAYSRYVALRLGDRYGAGTHRNVVDLDQMDTYAGAQGAAEMIAAENPDRRVAIYRLVATLVAPVGAIQIEEVD